MCLLLIVEWFAYMVEESCRDCSDVGKRDVRLGYRLVCSIMLEVCMLTGHVECAPELPASLHCD